MDQLTNIIVIAEGLVESEGEKLYADSGFLNRIQRLLPSGCELHHMGYGEFYLSTPKGRVDFDRMRGIPFEGCSGRSHLVYGDADAVRLVVEAATTLVSP